MELNGSTDGEDIPLSLISRFCDSKLKELTRKSLVSESDTGKDSSSIFSDIISGTSACSYTPKRREHYSGNREEQEQVSDNEHSANCADFAEPAAQQLQIKRKIPLSKHIKPYKLREFMREENCINLDNEETGHCFHADVNRANLVVKERLYSFLPALKRHVYNSEWAHLDNFPSLETLMLSSTNTESGIKNGPEYTHNTYQGSYNWDCEQAYLVTSTPELMVFYGIICKPSSIQLGRLDKLFSNAGVAPLPLQTIPNVRNRRIFLEDGTGRIELNDLSNNCINKTFVSGIPVAIIGKVSGAKLNVEDVIFATPCSPEWPFPSDDGIEMVFVSGLYLGNKEVPSLALDLFQDYLLGLAGSAQEQEEIIAPRVRLFLVGNMISKTLYGQPTTSKNATSTCIQNMEKLDTFLEPLVRIMEVFLIPGESDVTLSSTLPQPPMHPKLLPVSGPHRSLHRLSNPAKVQLSVSTSGRDSPPKSSEEFNDCSVLLDSSYAELLRGEVDFIDMVLQSGKNVKNIMEYCDIPCPIEMAQNLLKWAHLYPNNSSCDTSSVLAENLFSLKGTAPHVAVIGNLSEFRTSEFNGTKIIGVPSFHATNTAVVLTKRFEVKPLCFKLL